MANRRRSPRYKCLLKIKYKSLDGKKKGYCLSRDLGKGGIGIPLDRHISPRKRFIIEVSLPDREDKIVIKTSVVWCRRNRFHWQALFGAGLQVEKIDPELVERLLEFARTHQWQKNHFEEQLENKEVPVFGQAG